jgi:Ras family protein A
VFESAVREMDVAGTTVELAPWDTCGGQEYDRLRPLNYPDSHVVVINFVLNDRVSLRMP